MRADGRVIVLVEGFDDRAFWSGWLTTLGAVEARGAAPKNVKGAFTFRASDIATHIDVIPYTIQSGKDPLNALIHGYLELSKTREPLRAIIVNQDDDTTAGDAPARTAASVRNRLRDRDIVFDDVTHGARVTGGTQVLQFTWRSNEPATPHLPAKQTLERLVCAAFGGVYPDALASARAWLACEPPLEGPDHKASAGAVWAKWWSDHGWGDFYKAIWKDERVAEALIERLGPLHTTLTSLLGADPAD